MEGTSPSFLLLLFVLGIGSCIMLIHTFGTTHNPREPPLISATVPFIGHAIGLVRHKFNYYVQLSHQTVSPIFTMTMLRQKMYIVATPELIQAVQKQPKSLAFPPIAVMFATNVCGTSPEAHRLLMKNVNGDEGDWGLSTELYEAMRTTLAPGPSLDEMNRAMIRVVSVALNDLVPKDGNYAKIELNEWLRSVVTAATTESVYGPHNPFKEATVQSGFWQFESNIISLVIGIIPSVLARKSIAGRERIVTAFEDYFRAEGQKRASKFTQKRYETGITNGLPANDIARFEAGAAIALLVNTAPAAFWIFLFVYSSPSLLEDIRNEVASIMSTSVSDIGDLIRSLDITSVKTSCPLLISTFQEVLRLKSMNTPIRTVMHDTLLNDRWLLKKDSIIQMPTRIIHTDASIWGTDVNDFNPRRFLKDTIPQTISGKRVNSAAFRAFGGGTTLCPGRHFATTEILAVVTMFVMRFDMAPAEHTWHFPESHHTNVTSVIMEPDTAVNVKISPRKGFEHGQWQVSLRDSALTVVVVTEDGAV